jgi:hypothetical protein
MPYGYHNYLFGWIDTPDNNVPAALPGEFLVTVFDLLEKYDKNSTDTFFSAALNIRLGTSDLNIRQLAAKYSEKNMTLMDAAALVEKDTFKYHGFYHDGVARVCSSYVADIWKHGGIFGDHPINSAEFTPKDIYQLKIFEENP